MLFHLWCGLPGSPLNEALGFTLPCLWLCGRASTVFRFWERLPTLAVQMLPLHTIGCKVTVWIKRDVSRHYVNISVRQHTLHVDDFIQVLICIFGVNYRAHNVRQKRWCSFCDFNLIFKNVGSERKKRNLGSKLVAICGDFLYLRKLTLIERRNKTVCRTCKEITICNSGRGLS